MATPDQPNFDADTIEEAMGYLAYRIPQLAAHGWIFSQGAALGKSETGAYWGMLWAFRKDEEFRFAIYVLKSRRGQGHLPRYIAREPTIKFITIDDCNVESFYKKHGRDVLVLPSKT